MYDDKALTDFISELKHSAECINEHAKIEGFYLGIRDFMLSTLETSKEYIDYGEDELAFENLCDNLYEIDYPLVEGDILTLLNIGEALSVDKERYICIKKLCSEISPAEKYNTEQYLN